MTKPEAASAGTGMMGESGYQTQEVLAGVFSFPGAFHGFFVHLLSSLVHYAIAPANRREKYTHLYSYLS